MLGEGLATSTLTKLCKKNPVDVTEKVTLAYSLPLSEGLWFARAEFGKLCRCRKVAGSLDSFHITIDTIGT